MYLLNKEQENGKKTEKTNYNFLPKNKDEAGHLSTVSLYH